FGDRRKAQPRYHSIELIMRDLEISLGPLLLDMWSLSFGYGNLIRLVGFNGHGQIGPPFEFKSQISGLGICEFEGGVPNARQLGWHDGIQQLEGSVLSSCFDIGDLALEHCAAGMRRWQA